MAPRYAVKADYSDYGHDDYDQALREFNARAGGGAAANDDFHLSYPGEPIYAPRRRGSTFGRALVVSLLLTAGGFALLKTEDAWWPWAHAQILQALAAFDGAPAEQQAPGPLTQKAGLDQLADMPPPIAETTVGEAPVIKDQDDGRGAATDGAAKLDEPAASDENAAAAADGGAPAAEVVPLPPPQVDPADPYQKRALAVGLHPEISRAVLARLSDADYANAKVAIDKAIKDVADQETLVWPRQRVPKRALFKVHFVAGAAADCRRYVVTVTMDGWSTTAQPMERCGVKRKLAGAA